MRGNRNAQCGLQEKNFRRKNSTLPSVLCLLSLSGKSAMLDVTEKKLKSSQQLEKGEQKYPKASGREEITKIRAQVNEIKIKKTVQNMKKIKN